MPVPVSKSMGRIPGYVLNVLHWYLYLKLVWALPVTENRSSEKHCFFSLSESNVFLRGSEPTNSAFTVGWHYIKECCSHGV